MRRYGHVKKSRLENTSGLSTSVIALSAAVAAATSSLPTIAAEKQAEKNVLEEISITASRIQRSGFSAPTPTTVFNRDFLDARAETSLGDVLNESPQFFASRSPAANTLNANIVGANFMDLRGFGPNRTLVLLDGRRVVPTTDGNLVDLNLFPSALVERVEVVTGGASAAWGSDAVTGVVNVILKSDMDGFEGSIQTGQSEVGDAEEYKASLGWGGSFANDRARIMVGAELFETKGVVDQKSRSWARDEWQLVQNPNFGMEGEPQFITASNVKILPSTRGGFITSGPLAGTQFGEGGVPMSRELGTPSGLFMIGGDGVNLGADTST
ncbi:MAG: TonB-dependent receptor plug domain-containing protein, partial [Haliea sp.]